MEKQDIMKKLGGRNCGLCGMKTCDEFAEIVLKNPDAINRCPYVAVENKCAGCPASATCLATDLASNAAVESFKAISWKDNLGRDYDFVLDRMPGDMGPREHIVLFNPANVEKLHLKKGDVIYGRPAWISCGCLPKGELLITKTGLKEISSINKGEEVLGHDGKYHKVTETTKRQHSAIHEFVFDIKEKMIEITPNLFNIPIKMTSEHPIFARKRINRRRWSSYNSWIEAKHLNVGDIVMYPIIRDVKDIQKIKISDVIIRNKFVLNNGKICPAKEFIGHVSKSSGKNGSNEIINDITVDGDFCRLVGYYIAEGCTIERRLQFSFSPKEGEYISDVIRIVKEKFDISPKYVRQHRGAIDIVYHSSILSSFFKELCNTGAMRKKMPEWMVELPLEKQKQLLIGMWNGDGGLCRNGKSGYYYMYATSSDYLRYQHVMLLLRTGIVPSFWKKMPTKGNLINIIRVSGMYASMLSKILGEEDMWKGNIEKSSGKIVGDYVQLTIRKIKSMPWPIGGIVYNLEVENVKSYVGESFILHNCPVTHVGVIVEEPDYFNGTVVWNVIGPLSARKGGINIGYYNTTAYEGLVKHIKPGVELKIGMRHYFQPRYCMLQWRHWGIINQMAKTKDGLHIRIEGLLIG